MHLIFSEHVRLSVDIRKLSSVLRESSVKMVTLTLLCPSHGLFIFQNTCWYGELLPYTGSGRLQFLRRVQVELFGSDIGDLRQWKFAANSLLSVWCHKPGYWSNQWSCIHRSLINISWNERALNSNKSSKQHNIMSFTICSETFEISPLACLVLLSFVNFAVNHFLTLHLASTFLLCLPSLLCSLSLSLLELSKRGNEEDNSLADNSLAVPQIALVLSVGLAQSVHSHFYPLNLNLDLDLSPSPIEPMSSLLFHVLLEAPSTPFPFNLFIRFFSGCLSPLTSFFSPLVQVPFLSLQTPDSWGWAEENNILKRSVDNAAHWAMGSEEG